MPLMASRLLLSAPPRRYGFARVVVIPDSSAVLPPFTGKVVKTLLSRASPALARVFDRPSKLELSEVEALLPKPIHITPLCKRVERNGRTSERYLWKRASSKAVVSVEAGEKLYFYVGFSEDIEAAVLDALQSLDMQEAFGAKWMLAELEVDTSTELPSEKPPIQVKPGSAIVVEFRTPTLLLDPFKPSPYARFLPTPGVLLAYNIGDLARVRGRTKEYIEAVLAVEKALTETWKTLTTAKPVTYVYDGKHLPGLYGRATYKAREDADPDDLLVASNALSHAVIMGVGRGRAAGFGHVTVRIPLEMLRDQG